MHLTINHKYQIKCIKKYCTLFLSSNGTHTQSDHILDYKTQFVKLKNKTKQDNYTMLSDHNAIRLKG